MIDAMSSGHGRVSRSSFFIARVEVGIPPDQSGVFLSSWLPTTVGFLSVMGLRTAPSQFRDQEGFDIVAPRGV